ncbi:MAG: amidohydrolase family protein [Armatimonadota bacterium]
MHRIGLLVVIALAAATFLWTGDVGTSGTASSQEPALAIRNGRLFDATGAAPIEDGVVLIEGDRIVAAGRADEVTIPAHAATIDAAGGLIMPGIIDSHVHLTEPLAFQPQDILTPWLYAGVTTLVDNGTIRDGIVVGGVTIDDGVAAFRGLIDGVAVEPPRVLVAGPMLTAPEGYPATRPEPQHALVAQEVTSPEDARARVARLLDEQDADFIKVAIEAGFDADYDDPEWPVLPPETLAAIAEAVHERGRTVRAHVTQIEEFRAALEASFDVAAHTPLVPLPDDLLQQAADADMILVSTSNIVWEVEESAAAVQAVVQSNLTRYADLGGRVALGTDFPFQAGSEMPVGEMQVLVEGGLSPVEVLVAATKHGAEAVGRGDDLGTLEPGKLADIIVVDGDPLSDIADMANVSVVVLAGETVVPALSLPNTGGGLTSGERPVWPVPIAVLVAAGALLAGAGVLTARRR